MAPKLKCDFDWLYFSVFSDAFNHKDVKTYNFSKQYGVRIKILDFVSLPGESFEMIAKSITDILYENNINGKLIALCADNVDINFVIIMV